MSSLFPSGAVGVTTSVANSHANLFRAAQQQELSSNNSSSSAAAVPCLPSSNSAASSSPSFNAGLPPPPPSYGSPNYSNGSLGLGSAPTSSNNFNVTSTIMNRSVSPTSAAAASPASASASATAANHSTTTGGSSVSPQQRLQTYKYKTELCRNFEQTGHCAYRSCTFAHGIDELRAALSSSHPTGGVSPTPTPSAGSASTDSPTPNPSSNNNLNIVTNTSFSFSGRTSGQQNKCGGGSPPEFSSVSAPTATTRGLSPSSSAVCHAPPPFPVAVQLSPATLPQQQQQLNSAQLLSSIDSHLEDFLFELKREREAFHALVEHNRALERELHSLQSQHREERHTLTSLREKAAGLRAKLEVVPRPSFLHRG